MERIRVIDGKLSFEPNPTTRLLLEQVNLTVNTNQLLAARSGTMLGDAVDSLQFEKGSIKTKKLQATISHGSFQGNGTRLTAAGATIHDYTGKMTIKVKGLQLAGLSFDDSSDHIGIDQANWKAATVTIMEQPKHPAPQVHGPLVSMYNKCKAITPNYHLPAFIAPPILSLIHLPSATQKRKTVSRLASPA
ncbi:hypothetical protein [Paraflavitalea speifideaquila]|uniref:hypothetical protein n=1 Tax=Paraflavitalea speifideaquila TaxID=3076558 RepID=UPI0028F045BF|nr:hypothetical protein [Paraflavitalea speifideiaquila]